jgi:hypothetical protein
LEFSVCCFEAKRSEVGDKVDVELVGAAALAHGLLPGCFELELA